LLKPKMEDLIEKRRHEGKTFAVVSHKVVSILKLVVPSAAEKMERAGRKMFRKTGGLSKTKIRNVQRGATIPCKLTIIGRV